MFQEMINGSVAVLTKPSVSTFEEHEKNNLVWALIYAVIAGVINAIIQGLTAPFRVAQVQAQLQAQIDQLQAQGLDTSAIEAALAQAAQPNIIGDAFWALIATIIGSLIGWGIIYGVGRAFGGTGQFGELAWNISLFSSPFAVISTLLSLIPFAGGIVAFLFSFYGFYLGHMAIQSGLNLPSNKALYVIGVLLLVWVVVICGLSILFGLALGLMAGLLFGQ
jgi:Yip1 domain